MREPSVQPVAHRRFHWARFRLPGVVCGRLAPLALVTVIVLATSGCWPVRMPDKCATVAVILR